MAAASGGWRAMAELDSADGFPHSYLIKHPTHTSFSGSVHCFLGMLDDLRARMTICQATDYILLMGTDPMKYWRTSPGTIAGRVSRQLQSLNPGEIGLGELIPKHQSSESWNAHAAWRLMQ